MRAILLACAATLIASAQTAAPTKKTAAPVKDPGPARTAEPTTVPDPGPAAVAQPKAKSETLRLTVNWPSGLSFGEGEMTSTLSEGGWQFSFKVDFAIPAFAVSESATSSATTDLCSRELSKQATRGQRKTDETTKFEVGSLTATRETAKGGKSELKTSACPHDALTFVQFLRRELAAGRLPAAQPVYYGAAYQTRVQYKGTQRMVSGDKAVDADLLVATIKGPATELTVNLFFARDEARTPLRAELPLSLGKFAVEFSR